VPSFALIQCDALSATLILWNRWHSTKGSVVPPVEVQFDILTLIGLVGAAQALVVGTALLTTRTQLTRVFGLLLVTLGVAMGAILYSHSHPGPEPIAAVLVEVAVSLLAPVLLLGFVVLVVNSHWQGQVPLHAVVPTVWVVHAAVAALLRGPGSIWLPPIEGIVAYQIAYTLLSGYLVVKTRTGDTDVSDDALRWARATVFFMALINAAQVVRLFVDAGAWRDLVPITSGFVVIALTFVAARHYRVVSSAAREEAAETWPATPGNGDAGSTRSVKYGSSALSDEESDKGLARFRHAMEIERAYLQSDLTLDRLADELGLARTYLSQVINERCERPFLDVLADYRVREAQRILADDQARHLTVEAVGSRAGFQSKSAFYAAFKKRTGLAPAAFRRRLRRTESTATRPDRQSKE